MPSSARVLKFVRQLHRYLGIFIAPMLLFFAFTGAMQTLSLHESSPGSSYVPSRWAMVLAQIHKTQTDEIPAKKLKGIAVQAKPDKSADGKPTPEKGPEDVVTPAAPSAPQTALPYAVWKKHLPMKIFFLLVSLGLFTSTITGLYMAYKYGGSKVVVTVWLVAGILIPLILLKF
jgi:uncharacterized iron-regulated membrane protein